MPHPRLLRVSEVANKFRVTHSTVRRWAKAGKLTTVRTLGGHHRFMPREVDAFLSPYCPTCAQPITYCECR